MLAYQGFETGVFVFILCLDGGLEKTGSTGRRIGRLKIKRVEREDRWDRILRSCPVASELIPSCHDFGSG